MKGKNDSPEVSEWGQWAHHVLAELVRLNESLETIRKDLTAVTMEVVQLKVKSSLWGAGAGAITVILMLGIGWVSGEFKTKDSGSPPQAPITYIHEYPHPTPQTNQQNPQSNNQQLKNNGPQ